MSRVQSKLEKKCDIVVGQHLGNLSFNLNSARKEGRLCDFVIKVGSKEFQVHKIVLSEGSDYFKAMFSHKMKEMESGIAQMEDIGPDSMEICIEYVYTGKVSIFPSKIMPLVKAAHRFQLTGLYNALVTYLYENLDAESYFVTKDLANVFALTELEKKCDRLARQDFERISQQHGFKSLDKKTLLSLISDKENKASEGIKLKSILQWVQSEPQARRKLLRDLHKHLDLRKVPIKYRRKLIEDEPLVQSCIELMRSICISVMDSVDIQSEDLPSSSNAWASLPPTNQVASEVEYKIRVRSYYLEEEEDLDEILTGNGARIVVAESEDDGVLEVKFLPDRSTVPFNPESAMNEFQTIYEEYQ